MLEIKVPGRRTFRLHFLVLDVNGTIALDGESNKEVVARIKELKSLLAPCIITAGTQGNLGKIQKTLGIEIHRITPSREAEQKQEFVKNLGVHKTISIGNGANDALMLRNSAIGITVIGPEGAAVEALLAADIVVTDINNALDLLAKPKRLIATLRQ